MSSAAMSRATIRSSGFCDWTTDRPFPWVLLWLLIAVTTGCQKSAVETATESGNVRSSSSTSGEVAVQSGKIASPVLGSVEQKDRERGTGAQSSGDEMVSKAEKELAGLPDDLDFSRPVSLAEQRKQRDETVWKQERLAQEYERALVRMWDQLIAAGRSASGDPWSVLASQSLKSIRVARPAGRQTVRWGIEWMALREMPEDWDTPRWAAALRDWRDAGYRIVQTEWHHAQFHLQEDGTAESVVTMAIYGDHVEQQLRWVVSGDLRVRWRRDRDEKQIPIPDVVDTTNLKLWVREGELAFREVLTVDHAKLESRSGVQPILVQDLNDDGLSEIVLGGSNQIFWNRGNGQWDAEPLSPHWERGFEVALLADLNGDGRIDYLQPGQAGDLLLYLADEAGKFSSPPLGRARGGGPLKQPQVLTAGDIDRDGDLDVWIGQYKISYVGGQMPTPYYDANDGFPAYLLINDGKGRFEPQTEEAGLGAKANRRSYGGSFVDLNEDGFLDLLVVSDFSGVDVYRNDGKGYFTDVTSEWIDERHLFGMAATFEDYDRDGRLDIFVTGMASTTARRLEQMRLGRRDRADVHLMRSRMGYGNRMYLGKENGFAQPEFRDQVARTGWTWGATSWDVDNDGYPEIFVANGHSSGQSTKDHCSHFWCHDIYDATSEPNKEVQTVFNSVMQGYFDRTESWDGYQKNALLANLDGKEFVNVGYLMGIGHEYDGRAVVSNDLNGDGRLDLLVVEDRWQDGQLLHVYQNELGTDHHWIGVRFVDRPGGESPLGATVVCTDDAGNRHPQVVVAGDSIHAQHATQVHFGLGTKTDVQQIEIRYASGRVEKLDRPKADQVHRVEVP